MILDWKHIGLFGGAILLAGVGLHEYEQSVRADAVAQATKQAQDTYQKQLQAQVSDLQKQMADRDAVYQQQLQGLQSRLQQAATPQQIAQLVGQVMGLKQPITITTPPATKENPQPQPVAQVSLQDAPQVKAYIQDCETCKLEVPKLRADLADTKAKLDLQVKTTASVQKQSDQWEQTAKGGSIWKRTGRVVKVVVCAAAGGAAGGASGKGAIPAAIGAGAGAVACSLF